MYEVTYQKRTGEVFTRIRLSLPSYSVSGKGSNLKMTTSMGWIILQIKRV